MGRLIDADKLIKHICGTHCGVYPTGCGYNNPCSNIKEIMDSPTAYDVDKVVEQTKKVYACNNCHRPDECNECTVGEVIEIIKKGGIE